MNQKKILPLAAMEKLLRLAGADRVSDRAKAALRDVLETYGNDLSVQAIKLSLHAGRKTIKVGDIKLAVKK